MMKSFFKKLAFVMALAMVVSLAAPAATTASAAGNLKIAYQNGKGYGLTELNIAEVGATEDLKFLGAPSNWKELGATWTSNNEAVATVDQAGIVTAVAPGTAEVAVQIGAEVAVVKVNVVNVATYTATMGTTEDRNITAKTIEEGDTFDFAFYGIKDYDVTRYFCTWASDDTSVATVDQKGLVTAVKAGTAKITLIVFNKVTGQVHNVDACTVTVPGEATPTPVEVDKDAFTVTQKDIDTFILTFNGEKTADEVKAGLKVAVKIGDNNFDMAVDKVSVSGNVATVNMYTYFNDGEVYTLTYGKNSVEYTTAVGEIASIGIDYYTGKKQDNHVAFVAEEESEDYVTLVPVLYDAAGRNITDKYAMNNFDFSYEVSENVQPYTISDETFVFYNSGLATVTINATWFTDNGEIKELTGTGSFVVQKRSAHNVSYVKGGFINVGDFAADNFAAYISSPETSLTTDASSPIWNEVRNSQIFVEGDANRYVYAALFKDSRGSKVTTGANYQFGTFTFETSNDNVLSITDDGVINFEGVGTANVLVYFTPADGSEVEKFVGSTTITVTPERYAVSYKVIETNHTVASHVMDNADVDDDLNDAFYMIKFYDQYGDYIWVPGLESAFTLTPYDGANTVVPTVTAENSGRTGWQWAYVYDFDGSDFAGYITDANDLIDTYRYKVALDKVAGAELVRTNSATFALTVKNTKKDVQNLVKILNGDTSVSFKCQYQITDNGAYFDLAPHNVIDYHPKYAEGSSKTREVYVNYLSTGNLPIAKVRADHFIPKTSTTATGTSEALGYLYYTTKGPAKNTAGILNTTNADRWGFTVADDGLLKFTFNKWDAASHDAFAATGNYSVSLYTVNTATSLKLGSLRTVTFVASNSQFEVKYAGLNTEYNNKTEIALVSDATGRALNGTITTEESAIKTIIEQNLKFTYDGWRLGEYAGSKNMWDQNGIKIDWANSSITVNNGNSVRISKLAVIVPIDTPDGTYYYTSLVNVGQTIYFER